MMGTLQRIEQEAVSSQNMADAVENLSKTRSDVTGSRLRVKDGERLYPKRWSGNTPLGGLARGRRMAGICRSEARGGEPDTADHERDAQSD